MTGGLAPRGAALRLLHDVLHDGRMLTDAGLGSLPAPERARALALAGSVLRHMGRIDAVLAGFLAKVPPLRVQNALRLAAAEMLVEATPPHAAVDAAVRLVEDNPRTRHLKGLANAVARRVAAEGAGVWAAQDAPALSLTGTLRLRLTDAYGAEAVAAIATAHLAGAPLDLSLRDPATAAAWAAALGAEVLPTGGLRLPRGGQVSALAGFAEGAWWVQDVAASIPVALLGAVPGGLAGRRVIDLCAAPGGKTLQLAAAGAAVTAVDADAGRLARLHANLARTGLDAAVVEADLFAWDPDGPADAVLLDAPCSATGTIRRHPELPFVRDLTDLVPLTRQQDRMLARAFGWVRPGGILVFCTCSLLPEEGEARIARFLARHPDASLIPPPCLPGLDPGWSAGGMLRLRPDYWAARGGMDGFFVALIRREA